MAASQYHILLEDGSYLLTEDGLAHILLEEAPSLADEHDTLVTRRGDDAGGYAKSTGSALSAIYERQIREIEERFAVKPVPKTAKKRKAKIRALETAVEQFAQVAASEVYSLQPLLQRMDDFDGSESHYRAIMLALEAYSEYVRVIKPRRERHKRIAIAMLLAA